MSAYKSFSQCNFYITCSSSTIIYRGCEIQKIKQNKYVCSRIAVPSKSISNTKKNVHFAFIAGSSCDAKTRMISVDQELVV